MSDPEATVPPVPEKKIFYCRGYKYQLDQTYVVQVSIKPRADIITEWIKLNRDGMLAIMDGYAWDGPSGPTIDTKNFMRGSLVHDALYQLMREGHLEPRWREAGRLVLPEPVNWSTPHTDAAATACSRSTPHLRSLR